MIGVFGKPVQINSSYGWNVSRIADFLIERINPREGKACPLLIKLC